MLQQAARTGEKRWAAPADQPTRQSAEREQDPPTESRLLRQFVDEAGIKERRKLWELLDLLQRQHVLRICLGLPDLGLTEPPGQLHVVDRCRDSLFLLAELRDRHGDQIVRILHRK